VPAAKASGCGRGHAQGVHLFADGPLPADTADLRRRVPPRRHAEAAGRGAAPVARWRPGVQPLPAGGPGASGGDAGRSPLREARRLPASRERGAAFAELRREHGVREYDLQGVGSAVRGCYLASRSAPTRPRPWPPGLSAPSRSTRTGSGPAALQGHPPGLDSVEGKSSDSAVRFGRRVIDGEERPVLCWGRSLAMPLRIEAGNPVQLWAAIHVAGEGCATPG